jgi:hypothetical protein
LRFFFRERRENRRRRATPSGRCAFKDIQIGMSAERFVRSAPQEGCPTIRKPPAGNRPGVSCGRCRAGAPGR